MLSGIPRGSVQWQVLIASFTPTACLLALAVLILAFSPASAALLFPLLGIGLFLQALALLVVTRTLAQPTADDAEEDEECGESELTFSPVFHANPLPTSITILDEGRYIGANKAWLNLFGYTSDQVIGNTSLGLNIWVRPEERAELVRQLQTTGSVRDFEHLARTKTGDMRHLSVSAEVIEFNGVRYNLSLVHDITERKRSEAEMQRHNAYLEALHQVTLGVIRELNANELLATIVERSVQLINAAYGWVYLVTPEQDALELCVASGIFRQRVGTRLRRGEGLAGYIWQTGKPLAVDDYQEWAGRSKQYEGEPVRAAMGMPLKSGGQVIGVIGLTRTDPGAPFDPGELDLATRFGHLASIALVNARLHSSLQAQLIERERAAEALRKSELRFRTMFENSNVAMAITEVGDETVESNRALAKMLGYSLEELASLRTRDYTYPDDYAPQMLLEDEVMAGKRDHYQIEKRYVRKDGQIVWGRMLRSVARDPQGKILYRLGMVEDITEQKLAAQKLAEAYQTLEQRVAERTHELATLNAIAASVSRSLNLNEIMAEALARLMELTGMEHGIAYRVVSDEEGTYDPERSHLHVMASRGFTGELGQLGEGFRLSESAAGVAGRYGEPMVWSITELPSQSHLIQSLSEAGVQQVIVIPLMAKGHLVGSLNLSTNQTRTYIPEQMTLLKAIGQQVGVAVDNARLYEQAEHAAQAAERNRLSRELHDSVTQSLYSMTLYAEATARLLLAGDSARAAEHLRDLRDTAQEALREMRLLIFELRPPALENGLAAALQTRLDSVESRGGIHAELRVIGKENGGFPGQRELYNIALEALNNTLKHAHAQSVRVHLRYADARVFLEIHDDGVGFEVAEADQHGGFGISSMRERAKRIGALLDITSALGKGTCVTVSTAQQSDR